MFNIKKMVKEGVIYLREESESSFPDNPHKGRLFLSAERFSPGWWDGDNFEYLTFVDNNDVKTQESTVSNDDTEVVVSRIGLDKGALVKGRIVILRTFGKYSTDSSSDGFDYRIYAGDSGFDPTSNEGVKISEISTVQENVTDGPWQSKLTITVHSAGVNGTIAAHSEGAFNNNKKDSHSDPVNIDTTTAEEFVSTVDWNNAKQGNIVTISQSYLQQQA